jgi:hypothetical protein
VPRDESFANLLFGFEQVMIGNLDEGKVGHILESTSLRSTPVGPDVDFTVIPKSGDFGLLKTPQIILQSQT